MASLSNHGPPRFSAACYSFDAAVAIRQAQQNISDGTIVCFFCKVANLSDAFFVERRLGATPAWVRQSLDTSVLIGSVKC